MSKRINNKSEIKTKIKRVQGYTFSEEPIAFYVSEQTASYGKTPPFYYNFDSKNRV